MDLSRLKWATILAPFIYVLLAEIIRVFYLGRVLLPSVLISLATVVLTFVGASLLVTFITSMGERVNRVLNRQEERITALFNHTSDAMMVINRIGIILAINPAAEKMVGRQAGEVAGKLRCRDILECRDETGASLCLQGCFGAGGAFGPAGTVEGEAVPYFETNVRVGDGGTIPVTASASFIPSRSGERQLAVIIRDLREKRKLEAELRKRREQAESLHLIGLELSSLLDVDQHMQAVLDRVTRILGADAAGFSQVDESTGEGYWRTVGTGWPLAVSAMRWWDGEFAVGVVTATGEPLLVRDRVREGVPGVWPPEWDDMRSVLIVPVRVRERVEGAILVTARQPCAFGDGETIFLASLANQVAISLENRRLYEQVHSLAVLEERERLAREMHDGLGQTLTYLTGRVSLLELLLHEGSLREVDAGLAEMKTVLKRAHQEVRQAIFDLKTGIAGLDFLTALREYARQFRRQSGIRVTVTAGAMEGRLELGEEAEIQLIRIIQEALTNVKKHAGACQVTIALERIGGGMLRVAIRDDGRGFDPRSAGTAGAPHFGLAIMRERAESVGGTFSVTSAPGRGTEVTVILPLTGREDRSGSGHQGVAG